MDTEGRRRSDNFEDRGSGGGRAAGGGMAGAALFALMRMLGWRGSLVLLAVAGGAYLLAPAGLKQAIRGALSGDPSGARGAGTGTMGSVCAASPAFGRACDFSRVVLASTEDVWAAEFRKGALPDYGRSVPAYRNPTLVVFSEEVATGGCGEATSAVGPFYCPGDQKLYLDPSFYDTMAGHLHAPGDFAQAYVIAHEVGHHVQNLMGITDSVQAMAARRSREEANALQVRLELQADCFAGVWANNAQRARQILEKGDIEEGLNAAAAIGDDRLQRRSQGYAVPESFTHGSSAQRVRWFRRGLEGGTAGQCDTFSAARP